MPRQTHSHDGQIQPPGDQQAQRGQCNGNSCSALEHFIEITVIRVEVIRFIARKPLLNKKESGQCLNRLFRRILRVKAVSEVGSDLVQGDGYLFRLTLGMTKLHHQTNSRFQVEITPTRGKRKLSELFSQLLRVNGLDDFTGNRLEGRIFGPGGHFEKGKRILPDLNQLIPDFATDKLIPVIEKTDEMGNLVFIFWNAHYQKSLNGHSPPRPSRNRYY